MASFDEKAYEQFLIGHRRNKTNPEDLLERYAVTLPASNAEIAAQVKAVREYWNKIGLGNSRASAVAKWCRTQDEQLRRQPGANLESAAWWQRVQAERDAAADTAVADVVEDLKANYGPIGVVTAGTLGKYALGAGLTEKHARQAAARAGLTVVGSAVRLPDAAPIAGYRSLEQDLAECKAASVPELVHPGSGMFRIVARYECLGDPRKRLDAAAIESQVAEVQKRGVSGADNARVRALRMLRTAERDGVDLRDIALYHLAAAAQGAPTPTSAKSMLEKAGVESADAAVIAVLLSERASEATVSGLDKVRKLLDGGQLGQAETAAQTLTGPPEVLAEARQMVAAARQRLADLLAQARDARQVPDEAQAEQLLRDAAKISAEETATELATLPLAPPAALRAAGDGAQVTLFWQPGPGHDAETSYTVCRTLGRPPAAPTDGTRVHDGPGDTCGDPSAPVGRPVQYGVFARASGRPPSRPVTAEVTPLPPVSHLKAQVGTATIALSWQAHPDAEVLVTRSAPGAAPTRVPTDGRGCQVSGLPEGKPQHFELVAVYRGPGGTELRSAAEQITVTPRGEAKPITGLRARAVAADGGIRVRVTWPRVDGFDVRIMRSDAPPPWSFGTLITADQMAGAGEELSGSALPPGREAGFEAVLPPGVHYLVPLSVGGTGIAVGPGTTVAVTDPVRHLTVTPFADYANVAWEWPPSAQLAEVSWETDTDADVQLVRLADYRSHGGVRVPLGRSPVTVEVRAVIVADGTRHTSPPVSEKVSRVVRQPIGYRVTGLPSVGPFGGRVKKVTFTTAEGCAGVKVAVVASSGRVMPMKAADGISILETTLNLVPGVPAERKVTVPKSVRKPFWVRCFVVDGPARLIDPPIGELKEN